MTEGESKGLPVEGIDDIRSSVADAREKVATVEQLAQLIASVSEVQNIHTRLQEVARHLGNLALRGDPHERVTAQDRLQTLEGLLESVKSNPKAIQLVKDLDSWLIAIEKSPWKIS